MRGTLLLLGCALLCACAQQPARVQLADGRLEGYVHEGVEHYLGVPYAKPPTGDLRWRPPQSPEPWNGVLQVKGNPDRCTQPVPLTNSLSGREDCLYLNIWTPAQKSSEPMPVMVWIHGGGFIVGQGSYSDHDGMTLAQRGGVVVVTMNYRLGVFGFLAHNALLEEDPGQPTTGNYGVQDQTAALRWVRDNIAAFGGDPDKITLFGQSAGGVSVCAQLASPHAAGLFHRAVIQSAPCATPMSSLAAVAKLGQKVSAGLGCDTDEDELACMRRHSAEEVSAIHPPDPTFGFSEDYALWWPVLDGTVLPQQFLDAFEAGQFNQVPVISGYTQDEASLLIWLSHNLRFKPLRAEDYPERVAYLVGSDDLAGQVLDRYPLSNYESAFDAFTDAYSDGFFTCLTRWQTAALAAHTPTWSYRFDYADAPFFIPWARDLGAYHAAEIQYVFGRRMSITGRDFAPREADLADSMMGYWVQFARRGDPNGAGREPWPRYDETEPTLLFDLQNSVAREVDRGACEFWRGLPYLRPAYP
jgi:para-nitrobenzyl esterase